MGNYTPEEQRAYNRAYYKRNAEKLKAYGRAQNRRLRPWTQIKCAECGRKFETTRPKQRIVCSEECRLERARRNSRRQQHRRRGAVQYAYTGRDIARLVNRFHGLCAYCQSAPMEHIDHVVPLRWGGVDGIGNLLPACAECNRQKTDKLLVEWRYGRKRRVRLT